MNICLIANGYRDGEVGIRSAELTSLGLCLWVWMKSEVHILKVNKPDEVLACILDAAGCITTREDQLRRTARDLSTRVAKCIEVDGGILDHLL